MNDQAQTPSHEGISLGTWFGLPLTMRYSALLTAVCMWPILSLAARVFGGMSWPKALFIGSMATDWHWFFDIWHQYGHFVASKLVGYPMARLELWGPLSTSVYPPDEEPLPGHIHRRRALGGPIASGFLVGLAGILLFKKRPQGQGSRFLAIWAFGSNLLLFFLGALTPLNHLTNFKLGFDTDGDTLLRWWRK